MAVITKHHKIATISPHQTKMETKTQLSLDQCTTLTYCHLSWMEAITRKQENGYDFSIVKDTDL